MSAATATDLELWISKMMKTLECTDYKFDISGNSSKGDGYIGEITFVDITIPNQKNLKIVVKSAKQSDELRKQTPVKDAYDREIFVYSKILPLFEEFQKLKSIEKPFSSYAKCYYTSTDLNKECIFLENLKSIGYDLHNRKQAMNLNHVLMVVRNYGRLHALSLAMRHQRPAVFQSLTKNMSDVLAKFLDHEGMAQSMFQCFQAARDLLEADHPEIYKKYAFSQKEVIGIISSLSLENEPTSVIIHGDCWNNNFMFKYDGDDRTKPLDVAFLDFQNSKLSSVVADLSYFLYSCADQKCLEQFDFILQAYYTSLTEFLTELGSDPEKMLPYHELQRQWKCYGLSGAILATFLLKIALCDSDEAPDLAESCENHNTGSFLDFEIKDRGIYERRVVDVLLHYGERYL